MRRAVRAVRIGRRGLVFTNSLRVIEDALSPDEFRGAPAVPDWEELSESAIGLANNLFAQLEAAFLAGAPMQEVDAIRKQIEELGEQLAAASIVLGLLVPWKPRARKTKLIAFGPSKLESIFPWLKKAVQFIVGKKVVTQDEFRKLTIDQKQRSFTAPGIDSKSELARIRDSIADGAKEGESLAEYRKRVGDGLALTRAQTETVFRTNTHQGYIVGYDKGTKSKVVQEAFPAVMFSATPDTRVRDTHWALDGFICLKADPAYKVLLRAWKDWNCRCSPIPMTLEDAIAQGLKNINDMPPEVLKKYGQGISRVPAKVPELDGQETEERADIEVKDVRDFMREEASDIEMAKRIEAASDEVKRKTVELLEPSHVGETSPQFKQEIKSTLKKLPVELRYKVEVVAGIKIETGDYLTRVRPDLKGERPRGWPPGSTWDQVEGLFNADRKQIVTTQFVKVADKILDLQRTASVLNHEYGHAIDHAIGLTNQAEFMATYAKEAAAIKSKADRKALAYFLQAGSAGPSEAAAEGFAVLMGGSSDGKQVETLFKKYFPKLLELIGKAAGL